MTRSHSVIIGGGGIGGLTAALALARDGVRTVVLERAHALEETGAGIQLSPNASAILCAFGLRPALEPHVVAPATLRIRRANGATIAEIPIGDAEFRYGAPFWVIHRADLQAVLRDAVAAIPHISLRLDARVDDFAVHSRGVTVNIWGPDGRDRHEHGVALIGADGLWSTIRQRLGLKDTPVLAGRTAWRALVKPEAVPSQFRSPETQLWLGPNAHLVVYPVRAGKMINIVAVVGDDWNAQGWSTPGRSSELASRFAGWNDAVRELLAAPESWLKWALIDRAPSRHWGHGPVTLLGDAAHPMLPFLAQGGAMAIEDAAVLAGCFARAKVEPALRTYEGLRRARTARVQEEARRNNFVYHLRGLPAYARDLGLSALGGESLRRRYGWLYDWRPH